MRRPWPTGGCGTKNKQFVQKLLHAQRMEYTVLNNDIIVMLKTEQAGSRATNVTCFREVTEYQIVKVMNLRVP